jgi:hypothetical protein
VMKIVLFFVTLAFTENSPSLFLVQTANKRNQRSLTIYGFCPTANVYIFEG